MTRQTKLLLAAVAAIVMVVAAVAFYGARLLFRGLALSHVAANEPPTAQFASMLKRDTAAYFARQRSGAAVVDIELLRKGATQSGVAYPKYYAWVRVAAPGGVDFIGAVRVAAIDGERFEVTDYLSCHQLASDPSAASAVFPAALLPAIQARAASSECSRDA